MRKNIVLISLCALLAVTAAAGWGRAWQNERMLEESIRQRMLETQEHLQSISVKLGKAPVAGDARTLVELLSGVSRQADGVVTALSTLPLSHAALGDTVKFCNQLSEYALVLMLKAASGQMPESTEAEQLRTLEDQCTLMVGKLATADAIPLSTGQSTFTQDADHGMDYPSLIYDGAFSDARHRGTPKALGQGIIDQAQAIELARAFVGPERVQSAEAGVPTGGVIECLGVTLTLNDGVVLNADITRQGGKVLWLIPEHAAFEPLLTLEECTQKAAQFLSSRGLANLEPEHYQVYDGLAVINFVAVENGVLLYPDLIKVQIRMDTGELVGLESNNYLMNHTARTDLTAALTEAEARSRISPRLEVEGTRLCLIPYRDEERLCWEARGTYEDRDYRIYIDARTGEELQVLQMVDGAHGQLAV